MEAEKPTQQGSCSSCRHYSALTTQCRKGPPAMFPINDGQGRIQFVSAWPGTKPSDWCSAFEASLALL